MPRTRNLQTTNRNVRSPKTMTRPVSAVGDGCPGGTGRRIRPSPMRLPLELSSRGFRGDTAPGPAAVRDIELAGGSILVPTEVLPTERRPERRPIHSVSGSTLSPSTNRTPLPGPPAIARFKGRSRTVGRGARASAFYSWYRRSLCECRLSGNPPVLGPAGEAKRDTRSLLSSKRPSASTRQTRAF